MRVSFVIEREIGEMGSAVPTKIPKAFDRYNFRENKKKKSVKLLFKIKN